MPRKQTKRASAKVKDLRTSEKSACVENITFLGIQKLVRVKLLVGYQLYKFSFLYCFVKCYTVCCIAGPDTSLNTNVSLHCPYI